MPLTFWDRHQYHANHGRTENVNWFKFNTGEVITFLQLEIFGQFIHTIFLCNNKILLGPGGTSESVELAIERLEQITD